VIRYISTRGCAEPVDFRTALLSGLAPDGGLYVPERWPRFGAGDIESLRSSAYPEVAAAVMAPFTDGFVDRADLGALAADAYRGFGHPDVAPMVDAGGGVHMLELFWGPTLAFKDIAMQMLARMIDRALGDLGARATILGATSGDTGSAAIEAFRDRENVDVVILYPHGRVSEVQRRQMTTADAANVHAVAIPGTFDDCQDIVKALFSEPDSRQRFRLSTANSINWGRVVAQIPYYVWAALRLDLPTGGVGFAVPSGNFGNVFSGYAAAQMGLNVPRFSVGSNTNHVLHTFFESGRLELGEVTPTIAPSMDIQIPSNLERLLFDVYGREGGSLSEAMGQLRRDGRLEVGLERALSTKVPFESTWLDDAGIREVMAAEYRATGRLLDPHTAVGLHAARVSDVRPIVALATAHASKFPETVGEATGVHPDLPPHLADLLERPERLVEAPATVDGVRGLLDEVVR
jgi:threonine synthase